MSEIWDWTVRENERDGNTREQGLVEMDGKDLSVLNGNLVE